MLVTGFPAGPLQANCYVLAPDVDGPCVVVDPGQSATARLDALLVEHRLTPVAVLLTHGHLDHVASAAPVCATHDVPAFLHPADRLLLSEPMRGLTPELAAAFGGPRTLPEPAQVVDLADGVVLELAGLTLSVVHTPGHTPGSVVFTTAVRDQESVTTDVVLSGDTLFAGSVGRTDLPGGDAARLMASLQRLLEFPDAAVVLPGHGPSSTIGRERSGNPYLVEAAGSAAAGPVPADPVSTELLSAEPVSGSAPRGVR